MLLRHVRPILRQVSFVSSWRLDKKQDAECQHLLWPKVVPECSTCSVFDTCSYTWVQHLQRVWYMQLYLSAAAATCLIHAAVPECSTCSVFDTCSCTWVQHLQRVWYMQLYLSAAPATCMIHAAVPEYSTCSAYDTCSCLWLYLSAAPSVCTVHAASAPPHARAGEVASLRWCQPSRRPGTCSRDGRQ